MAKKKQPDKFTWRKGDIEIAKPKQPGKPEKSGKNKAPKKA